MSQKTLPTKPNRTLSTHTRAIPSVSDLNILDNQKMFKQTRSLSYGSLQLTVKYVQKNTKITVMAQVTDLSQENFESSRVMR